jgi:hypothetical protein
MNDHITIALCRFGARTAGPIAHWQRRLQAGDTFARRAGWTITRTRLGGRTYRDPRFSQLSATRTPGPPHKPAPPTPPTRHPPAPAPALATSACRPDGTAREDPAAGGTSKPPADSRLTSSVDDCRITKEKQL